ILGEDPDGRVACETLVTTGLIMVAGEITTSSHPDIPGIAREVARDVGYTRAEYGFDCATCAVLTAIDKQSPDIARGVDVGGAGDQGLMFGYACRETPELMPLPIQLAHRLTQHLASLRKSGAVNWLRPDGKSQVTVEYEGDRPVRVEAVVVATQHSQDVSNEEIRSTVRELVIQPMIPNELIDGETKIYINPTGRFVVGGPMGDCGLTGRKIIVDTYGGVGSHGGGAFSGKDPSKVDRSASYMARYIAKNCVAGGLADRLAVQLAYAIGVAEPVSIMVDTFGTGRVSDDMVIELIRAHFQLTPRGIIECLDLRRPIYRKTAAYGHFGREDNAFTWERTDKAELLRVEAGLRESDISLTMS
ncbi:MAG TPA: methionine adenosyltransferase, partial [Acidobacteriota bacterium]|nr:methionine adenosyltransferase [Acidobacteriota bacterium]